MRSHHARPAPPAEIPAAVPIPVTPELAEFLILEAAFIASESILEYSHCRTCGAAIGWGETVFHTDPWHDQADRICWGCTAALLMNRGALITDEDLMPAIFGPGVQHLAMPTLRKDRPPDRTAHR